MKDMGMIALRGNLKRTIIDLPVRDHQTILSDLLHELARSTSPKVMHKPAVAMDPDPGIGEEHSHESFCFTDINARIPPHSCHVHSGFCTVMSICNVYSAYL